jgi:hypothetical protein
MEEDIEMEEDIIIGFMTIGSGGNGGPGCSNTVHVHSTFEYANTVHTFVKMRDAEMFPPNDPFWTRNDDKPRPWHFDGRLGRFVDTNGVVLDLSGEEMYKELENLHNFEMNEAYKLTLGYKIRKFLGMSIPEYHNQIGWH